MAAIKYAHFNEAALRGKSVDRLAVPRHLPKYDLIFLRAPSMEITLFDANFA